MKSFGGAKLIVHLLIGLDMPIEVERLRSNTADILNLEEIKKHILDADIIHHLAGITDVAYVKKDSDKIRDELLNKGVLIEDKAGKTTWKLK